MISFIGLTLLALSPILPAYLWLRKVRPELVPTRFLLAYGLGLAAVLPALIIQYLLPPTTGRFAELFDSFSRIALIEELSRCLIFQLGRQRLGRNLDNGAKLGLVAGLGFAFFEDLIRLSLNPGIAIARIAGAVPLHAACSSRVGFAVLDRDRTVMLWLRLAAAVLIHGSYNVMLTLPFLPAYLPALFALAAFALAPAWQKNYA